MVLDYTAMYYKSNANYYSLQLFAHHSSVF